MKKFLAIIIIVNAIAIFTFWHWPVSHSYPEGFEISGFNFVTQPDNITCGPTSALMVLQKYNKNVTMEQIRLATKTTWVTYKNSNVGMTSPEYVSRVLKQFGISAHMSHGTIDDLKFFVSQKRPPIVLLRSGKNTWHYVVVIGYSKNQFFIADPGTGFREIIQIEDFKGAWNFQTDMDGKSIVGKCSMCGGTGHIGYFSLGPLTICDSCGGSGKSPDYFGFAVKSAEIKTGTMIVPNKGIFE